MKLDKNGKKTFRMKATYMRQLKKKELVKLQTDLVEILEKYSTSTKGSEEDAAGIDWSVEYKNCAVRPQQLQDFLKQYFERNKKLIESFEFKVV